MVAAAVPCHAHWRTSFSFHYPFFWGPAWGYYMGPYYSHARAFQTSAAEVTTAIHPKHARLYLDGRFIGIADDFDSFPGYLYLKNGDYQLEAQLGGYETQRIDIEADEGSRYDIRLRLKRVPSEQKERWSQRPERPHPLQRLYEPIKPPAPTPPSNAASGVAQPGPNLALRPDISVIDRQQPEEQARRPARLLLSVSPAQASVYLDGDYLINGQELARRSGPLLLTAGHYTIEAIAPGYQAATQSVDLAAGETRELSLVLTKQQE